MLKFKSKHCLTGTEFSRSELLELLQVAESCKEQRQAGYSRNDLHGKTVMLLFEKPSLRTRVSFTVGIQDLGGRVVELDSGRRKDEEPEDTIRVIGGYCHGAMIRTFAHSHLERMVAHSSIPVINGLSDMHHPCQVFADLQTLQQTYKDLNGVKLAYVGDGNNMLHSLLLLAPFLGIELNYACPVGFEPNALVVKQAKKRARDGGGAVISHRDPIQAVSAAQAVYTDVWTSMGFEREKEDRDKVFQPYSLSEKLYSYAAAGALIMHCMPMIRDKEIASSLIEHPNSALFRQSENRMHAQKALLIGLLGKH